MLDERSRPVQSLAAPELAAWPPSLSGWVLFALQACPKALEAGDFTVRERSAGASSGRNENVVRTGWLSDQVSVHHP